MMRRLINIIWLFSLLLLCACDVHEWPNPSDTVKVCLRLNYDTEMIEWEHLWDGSTVTEQGAGNIYDNHQNLGKVRYIVRAYPITAKQRASADYTEEIVLTKNISEGYNHEVMLELPSGSYNIMVWSDLVEPSKDSPYHNADNFAEITLQGDHVGSSNHRDAFRGVGQITLTADYVERPPETLDVTMQRPLSKFEFVTSDVVEFIKKEALRISQKSNAEKNDFASDDLPSRAVEIENYKVVFYYVGFMPHAYSLFTDKPVDSSTGVFFESTLKRLTNQEASMGFDYVFVNGKESAVTVQVAVYDNEGTQLSLTNPIEVPLKRNHHTVMNGMFLMSEASGGVTIQPDYDGDHNLIIP